MNEQIDVDQILLLDEKGMIIGIMTPQRALTIAHEKGLDVVEVAPDGTPPTCKLMDYDWYEQESAKFK